MRQRNDPTSGLPHPACGECGERITWNRAEGDGICDPCRMKAERVGEVRYCIAILERGLTAAQRGDRQGLREALRDARHEIHDLEKLIS